MEGSFRPLSRGLSFNDGDFALMAWVHEFSSPFLGTFFQCHDYFTSALPWPQKFSSPFLGTFFQLFTTYADNGDVMKVFVPFLGDFLSIGECTRAIVERNLGFRPLSWGLSFNFLSILKNRLKCLLSHVFVPFLGDFLSISLSTTTFPPKLGVFVPFLGDFLSIVVKMDGIAPFIYGFRPLSWGLSFNMRGVVQATFSPSSMVFVPFLGDFLSIRRYHLLQNRNRVFVPFLGDFLSILQEFFIKSV